MIMKSRGMNPEAAPARRMKGMAMKVSSDNLHVIGLDLTDFCYFLSYFGIGKHIYLITTTLHMNSTKQLISSMNASTYHYWDQLTILIVPVSLLINHFTLWLS